MSNDHRVSKDLIETLEDGKDGFAAAADRLQDVDAGLAAELRGYSEDRARLAAELEQLAATYGDDIDESGSVAAKVHRGWMALKDTLAGADSAKGVLDVAQQGEDHAVAEFERAVDEDLSIDLRDVVNRQLADVRSVRDRVRDLSEAHRA